MELLSRLQSAANAPQEQTNSISPCQGAGPRRNANLSVETNGDGQRRGKGDAAEKKRDEGEEEGTDVDKQCQGRGDGNIRSRMRQVRNVRSCIESEKWNWTQTRRWVGGRSRQMEGGKNRDLEFNADGKRGREVESDGRRKT